MDITVFYSKPNLLAFTTVDNSRLLGPSRENWDRQLIPKPSLIYVHLYSEPQPGDHVVPRSLTQHAQKQHGKVNDVHVYAKLIRLTSWNLEWLLPSEEDYQCLTRTHLTTAQKMFPPYIRGFCGKSRSSKIDHPRRVWFTSCNIAVKHCEP